MEVRLPHPGIYDTILGMRVEPYGIGSILHVIKRGARGMKIARDEADRKRFMRSLYYLNDKHKDENWHRTVAKLDLFEWPEEWPQRKPLVRILAWMLHLNHFHLLLQEIDEGGIAKFMQRFCGSMSVCFNLKYKGQGSIFQGSYRGRRVDNDTYFRHLVFYILVKNTMELYRGGITAVTRHFDDAWQWALNYQYSSLPDHLLNREFPIVDDAEGLIGEVIGNKRSFKKEAKEMLMTFNYSRPKEFESLLLESW